MNRMLIVFAVVGLFLSAVLFSTHPVLATGSECTVRGQHANLSGCDLSGVDLTYITLRYADFTDATLVGTDFDCTDLQFVDFSHADLSNAILLVPISEIQFLLVQSGSQ